MLSKVTAVVVLCLAVSVEAATRLTYMVQGKPTAIKWADSAFPVSYKVDAAATTAIPGAQAMIGRSFDTWLAPDASSVQFTSLGTASAPPGKDGVNGVSLSDNLFSGSGFLAFTTTWFDNDGKIIEADIQVDASVAGDTGKFESLVQHEVGHFLGLDHSAIISSTMYPFVASTSLNKLDSDDRIAIASMYPKPNGASLVSTLRGEVQGGSGPLFGAQVVALNESGSPVASVLSDRQGRFEMVGVPEGKYKLYVEPLDGPVDPQNLSGYWRDAHSAAFRTEFSSESFQLEVKAGQVLENLVLNASQPSTLSPRWIGTFPINTTDIKLGSTVNTVKAGDTICIAVGGEGLIGGMTQFSILSSNFSRVSDFRYGPNYVWATFKISPDQAQGSLVVLVANGSERATLTGGLKVDGKVSGGRTRPIG